MIFQGNRSFHTIHTKRHLTMSFVHREVQNPQFIHLEPYYKSLIHHLPVVHKLVLCHSVSHGCVFVASCNRNPKFSSISCADFLCLIWSGHLWPVSRKRPSVGGSLVTSRNQHCSCRDAVRKQSHTFITFTTFEDLILSVSFILQTNSSTRSMYGGAEFSGSSSPVWW